MEKPPNKVVDDPARHQFQIDLGDGELAFAKYSLVPGAIRFYHTVVPEHHRGQGLGTELIEAGLAVARQRGWKVVPACSFFAAYLKRHADQQDLIPPEYRYLIE